MKLEVLFHLLEHGFYIPTFLIQKNDLFVRNVKIIGNEFVNPSLFVFVGNFPQTKSFYFFIFNIFDMDMLLFHNPKFFVGQLFLKKYLQYFIFGIVFNAANKIYTFLCPMCKLQVMIVGFVEINLPCGIKFLPFQHI